MTFSINLSISPSLWEISITFISNYSYNAANLLKYTIGIRYKKLFLKVYTN